MNNPDLEQRDINEQTPLHVAAKLGRLQAIEYVTLEHALNCLHCHLLEHALHTVPIFWKFFEFFHLWQFSKFDSRGQPPEGCAIFCSVCYVNCFNRF